MPGKRLSRKRAKRGTSRNLRDRHSRPELVIGVAAAVGTPLDLFTSTLQELLLGFGYKTEILHLSRYTEPFRLETPLPARGAGEAMRISTFMDRGNELRKKTKKKDILALCAISDINQRRPRANAALAAYSFVLRQLKRPEEVYRLRQVYRDGFHLVGLYCPRSQRKRNLRSQGIGSNTAETLIDRDEHEALEWGQDLRSTFHLSDVFLDISQEPDDFEEELKRWLELLFGTMIHSPTISEFGIFQANAAALRSAQLSRQVGAAILTDRGEVISVGSNEVPCFGGGQYWATDLQDARDHVLGSDSNDQMVLETLREVLERVHSDWSSLNTGQRDTRVKEAMLALADARIMNLTEFGRAVHAEMEALLAAARTGVSTKGHTLFTTTFPCHNCTKHIVGSGLKEVVYIEPYPKSLGPKLHEDSVALEQPQKRKVTFRPFVGVAPRRYDELFSTHTEEGTRIRRKDRLGTIVKNRPDCRLKMSYESSLELEALAAKELRETATERRQP